MSITMPDFTINLNDYEVKSSWTLLEATQKKDYLEYLLLLAQSQPTGTNEPVTTLQNLIKKINEYLEFLKTL